MSSFQGINVHAAPRLVLALHGWPSRIDAVIALVNEGELLSDLSVNVSGQLDQIGSDGRVMATAIDQAAAEIMNHTLVLTSMPGGITLPRLGPLGQGRAGRGSGVRQSGGARGRRTSTEDAGWQGYAIAAEQALSPEQRLERLDELRNEIRRDTAAGRDSAAKFGELNRLLAPLGSTLSATSLLMQDLPAADLADGPDAVLDRIVVAMVEGTSPTDAALPEAVFPDAYVARHRQAGAVGEVENQLEINRHVQDALDATAIAGRNAGTINQQIATLNLADAERRALTNWFTQNFPETILNEHYQLSDLVASNTTSLQAQLDQMSGAPASGPVPTLHGSAAIDDEGRLQLFDAIGATARVVSIIPSTFVGSAYAANNELFEARQLEQAVAFVAQDQSAAVSFFEVLGPDDAALFLSQAQRQEQYQHRSSVKVETSQLARDLSTGFGLASGHLPRDYAEQVVQMRSDGFGSIAPPIAPEWLFAYGDFDPDFLVAGAAASIEVHQGTSHRFVDRDLWYGLADPRQVVLEPLVKHGLGGALVERLHEDGMLGSFVWTQQPVNQGGLHHITGEPIPPPSEAIPLVSQLLLQAGLDDRASELLINSAGSRLDDLDLDIANGLSQVLAGQVPNFIGVDASSPFFNAAQNIFAAGAGIDIDVAVRVAALTEFNDGFLHGEPHWYNLGSGLGAFAGYVDARKFLTFQDDARLQDQAIENSAAWISGITSGVGIVAGVIGIPFTGGASLTLTAVGIGASGAGWIGPIFLDAANNLENFYFDTLETALEVNLGVEGMVLVSAALSEVFEVKEGSFTAHVNDVRPVLVLTTSGSSTRTWRVDWNDPSWVLEVKTALAEVSATVDLNPYSRVWSSEALNLIGGPFAAQYELALQRSIFPSND